MASMAARATPAKQKTAFVPATGVRRTTLGMSPKGKAFFLMVAAASAVAVPAAMVNTSATRVTIAKTAPPTGGGVQSRIPQAKPAAARRIGATGTGAATTTATSARPARGLAEVAPVTAPPRSTSATTGAPKIPQPPAGDGAEAGKAAAPGSRPESGSCASCTVALRVQLDEARAELK